MEKAMDDLLSNEAQVSSENVEAGEAQAGEKKNQLDAAHCHNVYSGKAFTERELMHLSAKKEVKLILVAGPHESGKTTLLTMFYQMFLVGANENMKFAGSYTMPGFWERRKDLLLNSGRATPKVARTFLEANDNFLHLNIMDKAGNKQNLVFSDISGEGFEDENKLADLREIFEDISTILLVLDGAKLADLYQRRIVFNKATKMFGALVQHHIAGEATDVMLICTKADYIDSLSKEEKKICNDFIQVNVNKMKQQFQIFVNRISFGLVSLQDLQESETLDDAGKARRIESVLDFCMKSEELSEVTYLDQDERTLSRHFEKYGLYEDEDYGE